MLFSRIFGAGDMRTAIDSTMAVVEFSTDGTVLTANKTFLTVFGLSYPRPASPDFRAKGRA